MTDVWVELKSGVDYNAKVTYFAYDYDFNVLVVDTAINSKNTTYVDITAYNASTLFTVRAMLARY